MPTVAARTCNGANQWTTPVQILGWLSVSVSAVVGGPTLGGTIVRIQRSPDGIDWYNVDKWTKESEDVGFENEIMWYTIGVETGEFVASVYVRIGVTGSMRS